jgi:hypothetical protein
MKNHRKNPSRRTGIDVLYLGTKSSVPVAPAAPLSAESAEAPVINPPDESSPSLVELSVTGSPTQSDPATAAQTTAAVEVAAPDNNVSPSEAATVDKHTMQDVKSQDEARPPAGAGAKEAQSDAPAEDVLRITSDMYAVAQPSDPPSPATEVLLSDSARANKDRRNGDETDARMSEIVLILDHAAMRLLDKCALVAEWVGHAEAKASVFGQPVQKPQGGRPEGGGVSRGHPRLRTEWPQSQGITVLRKHQRLPQQKLP